MGFVVQVSASVLRGHGIVTACMQSGDKEILADFDRTRSKTLALLKIVPAKLLARKAEGEDATLGELFHHIAATNAGWMARCMQDRGPLPAAYVASKPAISKALSAARKRVLQHFKANGGAAMDVVYEPKRLYRDDTFAVQTIGYVRSFSGSQQLDKYKEIEEKNPDEYLDWEQVGNDSLPGQRHECVLQ